MVGTDMKGNGIWRWVFLAAEVFWILERGKEQKEQDVRVFLIATCDSSYIYITFDWEMHEARLVSKNKAVCAYVRWNLVGFFGGLFFVGIFFFSQFIEEMAFSFWCLQRLVSDYPGLFW